MIVGHLRCTGCLIPATAGQKLGDKCPGDCQYCVIVEVVEAGRYWVELRSDGDKIGATGFVGENLSREFGDKTFSTIERARKAAVTWTARKYAEAN